MTMKTIMRMKKPMPRNGKGTKGVSLGATRWFWLLLSYLLFLSC